MKLTRASEMNNKVYIVDDDQYARESLAWLIESVNLKVKSFDSAITFLEQTNINVSGCLILDVRMPGINGIELFEQMKNQNYNLPVIIITGHADVTMAVRAMKAGVFDFIEKPYNDSLILERIQNAIAFDESNQRQRNQINKIKNKLQSLTPREHQVLDYVISSTPNKIIADRLSISIKTVELHRSNLMNKMQATSATELVRQVMLIEPHKGSI